MQINFIIMQTMGRVKTFQQYSEAYGISKFEEFNNALICDIKYRGVSLPLSLLVSNWHRSKVFWRLKCMIQFVRPPTVILWLPMTWRLVLNDSLRVIVHCLFGNFYESIFMPVIMCRNWQIFA